MLTIISGALAHWKAAVALAIAAALAAAFFMLVHERDAARAQVIEDARVIQTLTDQKAALQGNVNLLTDELAKQSASVAALSAAGEAAKKAAQDAMQAAAERSKKDAAQIADLRKRGADKTNTGSCDAEIQRIRAGL